MVECRSDGDYAGRPLVIHWEGKRLDVKMVLAEWRSPDGKHFRIVTRDERVFECRYSEAEDAWTVESGCL